jgi:hypothetical protein
LLRDDIEPAATPPGPAATLIIGRRQGALKSRQHSAPSRTVTTLVAAEVHQRLSTLHSGFFSLDN